jgi:hypothetical protein
MVTRLVKKMWLSLKCGDSRLVQDVLDFWQAISFRRPKQMDGFLTIQESRDVATSAAASGTSPDVEEITRH